MSNRTCAGFSWVKLIRMFIWCLSHVYHAIGGAACRTLRAQPAQTKTHTVCVGCRLLKVASFCYTFVRTTFKIMRPEGATEGGGCRQREPGGSVCVPCLHLADSRAYSDWLVANGCMQISTRRCVATRNLPALLQKAQQGELALQL